MEVRIPPVTRDEVETRRSVIRGDVAYAYRLTLAEGKDSSFLSESTVTFDAVAGESTFIDLVAESVDSIVLNGKTLPASAWKEGRIELSGLAAHNTLEVIAHCPYREGGMGMQRSVDSEDGNTYLYTQGEAFEMHSVFACFDQPDIKGVYTGTVTCPDGWVAASNAPVAAQAPGAVAGTTAWTFQPTKPIAPYLATVLAGPYHVVKDDTFRIPIELYCRESMAKYLNATDTFDAIKRAIGFYEKRFGIPYPFEKIGMAWVPDFTFGAMENPGIMTFVERTLPRGDVSATLRLYTINTLFHEIGHMWFGDLATMRWWNDLWLNESFATFVSHKAQDEAYRTNEGAVDFIATSKEFAIAADQRPSSHPISVPIGDTSEIWSNFDRIAYEKGSSVLQQLEAYVGEKAFWEGIHSYLVDRSYGNATLADLLSHLEKASGRKLDRWADLWLNTQGVNTLEASFTSSAGKYDSFRILQGAATPEHPTLRPHRLRVGLYDFNGKGELVLSESVETEVDGAESNVTALIGKRVAPLVLVNDGSLTFAKVSFDPKSLETVLSSIHRMTDPVARTICNGMLWNMTRDGKLPVRDYVDVVCRQTGESAPSVLEALLTNARTAIKLYADPSERDALQKQLHATCETMLKQSEGTEYHMSWFEAYVASAGRDDVPYLKALLSGKERSKGLRLSGTKREPADPDLRWKVVIKLASLGAITEAGIRAETRRDPSVAGGIQALGALAARPGAEAKRQAWGTLMSDGISIAKVRAIGLNMWQTGQERVLAPYFPKLAAAVEMWNAKREEQTLSNLVERALPTMPEPGVMKAVSAMLASTTLSESVKREVRDLQDELGRAVHAREMNAVKPRAVPVLAQG